VLDLALLLLLFFAVVIVLGFGIGWGIRAAAYHILASGIERDMTDLRRRISEARAKPARDT
jgi:hypothetical protein